MPPLSLLIKPSSSDCNLRCKYCFYHSIAESRKVKSYGHMSLEILEMLVKKALKYSDNACTFAFQGGEPTLVGFSFFEKLIEFEKKYNIKKVKINNALQTNGMSIDEKWAQFLFDNKFLVGLSLDGPKDINDVNRIDIHNKSSFMRVMKTADLFNKYTVEYNILFVVNAYVAGHAAKVYNFFKKNNFKYIQFIPCLDPLDEIPGGHEYSLKPEKYTKFLKEIFDLWYADMIKDNIVSIRYFDNLVGMFMGYKPEACGMLGECSCQFVVEADGSTYPCDFYVTDDWCLGNISIDGLDEMKNSDISKKFVVSSKYIDPKCIECRWAKLCRGGCRRNREPFADGKPGLNYLCPSYLEFFDYAADRICRLAEALKRRVLLQK